MVKKRFSQKIIFEIENIYPNIPPEKRRESFEEGKAKVINVLSRRSIEGTLLKKE